MSKVHAAAETLHRINPDVEIEYHNYNIIHLDHFEHFIGRLTVHISLFSPLCSLLSLAKWALFVFRFSDAHPDH